MAGLVFGVSKDGSQCPLKMRTRLAKFQLSPFPIPCRNIRRASDILPSLQVHRRLSFTRWLIAGLWLTGRSNGVSNGAGAPIRWKRAGYPGGMRKRKPSSKSGIYYVTNPRATRLLRSLRRTLSEINVVGKLRALSTSYGTRNVRTTVEQWHIGKLFPVRSFLPYARLSAPACSSYFKRREKVLLQRRRFL